jgi:hypothetical protein
MAETAARICPRCGGVMAVRLGEYECRGCGHFLPLSTPDPGPAAAGQGRAPGKRREVPAIFDRPQPPPSRVNQALKADPRPRRIAVEKTVFVSIATLVLVAGNCLALAPAGSGPAAYLRLVIGALVFSALAAGMLYVNWEAFQQWAVVAVVVLLGIYAYSVYSGWADYSPVLRIKLCADGCLMLWLATLLWRSSHVVE